MGTRMKRSHPCIYQFNSIYLMKKPFFFCAAVLLQVVLFSCNDGDSEDRESVSDAVGFSASSVNDASRAAVLDLDGLKTSGFLVNAYSTGVDKWASVGSSTAPEFMYKQGVTWDGNKWTYDPVKYWPGKVDGSDYGKLSFFAWSANAESIASVLGNDETSGTPKLSVTVPDSQGGQKDLVTGVVVDETSQTASGAVKFAFKHVLSRIGFTAKFKDAGKGVPLTVTSLKVKYAAGKVKSKATYTFGDTDGAPGGWALDATYMSNTAGDEVVAGGVPLNDDGSSERLNGVNNFLMLLPQAVDDGAIELEVSWEVGTANPKQVLTQKVILPAQTWEQGYSYDYNLVVSLVEVTFGGVTVKPWNEAGVLTLCELTYDANNGTGEKIKKMLFTGRPYSLIGKPDGFTPPAADYAIYKWNTKANGTGTDYKRGDPVTLSGDMTLYAQWIDPTINVESGTFPDGPVTYGNNVFTIVDDLIPGYSYIVIKSTGAGSGSNGRRIKVASDVTATVTLRDATIDVSNTTLAGAFEVESGADVTLVLEGTNTLKSGARMAGLHVPDNSAIRITGISGNGSSDGTLMATGGNYNSSTGAAAGIGGGGGIGGGNITIAGGTVTATGGNGGGNNAAGAGIGGGGGGNVRSDQGGSIGGSGGNITIAGGTVTAKGGQGGPSGGAGAGIGGGGGGYGNVPGSGGNIIITGGSVTATGGDTTINSGGGAGIGSGGKGYSNDNVNGGSITITGGNVTATGGKNTEATAGTSAGAGIGGGGAGQNRGGCDAANYTGPGDDQDTSGTTWSGWDTATGNTAYVSASGVRAIGAGN